MTGIFRMGSPTTGAGGGFSPFRLLARVVVLAFALIQLVLVMRVVHKLAAV
jgi:hypothetical protein